MPARRRTRYAAAVAALAAAALVLVACATPTTSATSARSTTPFVGIVMPGAAEAAGRDAGAVLAAELTARGYDVDVQYALGDAPTQRSQVENLVTKDADLIVVAPPALDELEEALAVAAAAEVPVVAYGGAVATAATTVAFDEEQLGALAVRAAVRSAGETVAALASDAGSETDGDGADDAAGAAGDDGADTAAGDTVDDGETADGESARVDAAAVVDGVPAIGVVESAEAGPGTRTGGASTALEQAAASGQLAVAWETAIDEATAETQAAVTAAAAGAPAVGVLALTEAGASEAAQAASAGSAPRLFVSIGRDLDTLRRLDRGDQDAVVFLDPVRLAVAAADAVEEILLAGNATDEADTAAEGAEAADETVLVPGSLLTGAAALTRLIDDGYVTRDELDASDEGDATGDTEG